MHKNEKQKNSEDDHLILSGKINEILEILQNLKNQYERKCTQNNDLNWHLARINASPWWRFGLWVTALAKEIGIPDRYLDIYIEKPVLYEPILERIQNKIDNYKLDVYKKLDLAFPCPDDSPLVSLIIPSFGHVQDTLKCLTSIYLYYPKSSIEIIVSDDASNDPELIHLKNIKNIRYFEMEKNLGWLDHVNYLVAHSKGKYIYILNNDTELHFNSIDSLINVAENYKNIGAVGSKLLYPDGKLQEAGGIIWENGKAWNYGKFDNPDKPEYSYLREVDYCSGASLLVSKKNWDMLSGFDSRFAPAYYEDVDLCFRLREAGLKIIYQPLSLVTHSESATYGTDENSRKQDLLQKNYTKFQSKWRDVLFKNHEKYGKNISIARDRSHKNRSILVIDHYVPESDMDGGSLSTLNIINSLIFCGWSVKFWPDNLFPTYGYTTELQQMGVEVLYTPWVDDLEAWLKSNYSIDYILLIRPSIAINHLDMLIQQFPEITILYYGVDLHFMRLSLEAKISENGFLKDEANKVEKIEKYIWNKVSCSFYPSEEEVQYVKDYNKKINVKKIPLFSFKEFKVSRCTPKNKDILFVGNFTHTPNISGMIWFLESVYPQIFSSHPTSKVLIAGPGSLSSFSNYSKHSNINLLGHVSNEQLEIIYENTRCVVVPLLAGAGVKMKTIQAICRGIPIVSTPIGVQGIAEADQFIKISDNENEFAKNVIELLDNDDMCDQITQTQLKYAIANYSFYNVAIEIEKKIISSRTAK